MTISLLRGDFALVWWSGLISMTGSWMLSAALPAFVYLTTRSVLAASLMFVASLLPRVLLGGWAGSLADRYDRRVLLAALNALAALSLLPLLALDARSLWLVYVVEVLETLVLLPLGPAENSLLPALVSNDTLPRANALNALNNNLARLVGPALGGVMLTWGGLDLVVLVDVASYVLAALLIWRVRYRGAKSMTSEEPVKRAWRSGLAVVWRSSALRLLTLAMAVGAIGEGVFGVLLAPFVTSVLGGDARAYGLVISAQAIGGLVGGVVAARYAHRWEAARLLTWGSVGLGLVDLAMFVYPLWLPIVPPAVALMVLAGIPASFSGAAWATLMQRHASDAVRGRAFGVAGQLSAVGVFAGVGIANLAREAAWIVPVISTHAATLLLGGILLGALGRRAGLWSRGEVDLDGRGAAPARSQSEG
ncbi:MFS transporter [Deinococcus yavapaiensis]|uniref:Putative MFS family arabinose efflux permease n=1 Tax=Deinococcus yavapaiensis KR-236 TaxID=694435 RepID=A0A318SML0_9DEIO|nr:MFS transporter [Deinococcus yavapaiensis]PYE53771.1 putative MFS family arabinose efflux permease [Deinococcus yavapaiensis KR-236]